MMEEKMISRGKSGGSTKLCAGWRGDLGSVMHGTACRYFRAGISEGYLARGPTYTRNQLFRAEAKNV